MQKKHNPQDKIQFLVQMQYTEKREFLYVHKIATH